MGQDLIVIRKCLWPIPGMRVARDVAALEAQINRLVYQLYGLTEEESAIV